MLDRPARCATRSGLRVGDHRRDRNERSLRPRAVRARQRLRVRQARGRAGRQQGQADLSGSRPRGHAFEIARIVHLLGGMD